MVSVHSRQCWALVTTTVFSVEFVSAINGKG